MNRREALAKIWPVWIFLFIVGCSPISQKALTKRFKTAEETFHDHIGFVLYDVKQKKTVFDFNGSKYFTPASNTKIFTLYASLRILCDVTPGIKYEVKGDSLFFWGTGDPSLLYKNVYSNTAVLDFLKSSPQQLYFSSQNFNTVHFGPGWAWDDYNDYYSVERSPLPVYGNIATIAEKNGQPSIVPSFLQPNLFEGPRQAKPGVIRDQQKNQFIYFPGVKSSTRQFNVPMRISDDLVTKLLGDTLKRIVKTVERPLPHDARILKSVPTDSLYRVMMQDSDNFIAEQLLLMCSGVLSDTLQPEVAIRFMKKNYLNDLADEPIWKDGSGLSRFNLFTPRSIVQLWQKIYDVVPQERLFPLLAIGGKKGTIRNYYKSDKPYVFGKTGSLNNNHCLSGYLVTKKGTVMIFSFMNNHFINATSDIRNNMQETLNLIYENY